MIRKSRKEMVKMPHEIKRFFFCQSLSSFEQEYCQLGYISILCVKMLQMSDTVFFWAFKKTKKKPAVNCKMSSYLKNLYTNDTRFKGKKKKRLDFTAKENRFSPNFLENLVSFPSSFHWLPVWWLFHGCLWSFLPQFVCLHSFLQNCTS